MKWRPFGALTSGTQVNQADPVLGTDNSVGVPARELSLIFPF
jgi:hypothetical protein